MTRPRIWNSKSRSEGRLRRVKCSTHCVSCAGPRRRMQNRRRHRRCSSNSTVGVLFPFIFLCGLSCVADHCSCCFVASFFPAGRVRFPDAQEQSAASSLSLQVTANLSTESGAAVTRPVSGVAVLHGPLGSQDRSELDLLLDGRTQSYQFGLKQPDFSGAAGAGGGESIRPCRAVSLATTHVFLCTHGCLHARHTQELFWRPCLGLWSESS